MSAYFREARGCEIVDSDGRGSSTSAPPAIVRLHTGYADPASTDAVVRRVHLVRCRRSTHRTSRAGTNLLAMSPLGRGVRYARGGGEAMAVLCSIARAATGRYLVAFALSRWCICISAANLGTRGARRSPSPRLIPAGVPRGLAGRQSPSHSTASSDRRHRKRNARSWLLSGWSRRSSSIPIRDSSPRPALWLFVPAPSSSR